MTDDRDDRTDHRPGPRPTPPDVDELLRLAAQRLRARRLALEPRRLRRLRRVQRAVNVAYLVVLALDVVVLVRRRRAARASRGPTDATA